MLPTRSQIQLAAYYHWERLGQAHGHHEANWLAAEQDLLLSLNYEMLRIVRLDGRGAALIGDSERNVCRFCELGSPRVTFDKSVPALPRVLGGWPVFSADVCDDCHDQFQESVDDALDTLLLAMKHDLPPRRVPIAAIKGLTRLALGFMPHGELDYFADAMEWVINPDHEFDRDALGPLRPQLERSDQAFASPWAAILRRADDEEPMPYMLFFLGVEHHVITLPVPLCQRDEDLEGQETLIPLAGCSLGLDQLAIMSSRRRGRAMSPLRDLMSVLA